MVAVRFDVYHRLQPRSRPNDLQRGFRAEVHDPAWLIGRQWQLGEHIGEDASSPVEVEIELRLARIHPPEGVPHDPRVVPPEAIVEAELDDWWTPGRRIRLGRAYALASGRTPGPDEPLTLDDLAAPYERLNGAVLDGWKAWLFEPDHVAFAEVPYKPHSSPPDHWSPSQLIYEAAFSAGEHTLELSRHDGGPLDWFSVDATASAVRHDDQETQQLRIIPTRFQYPGAPHPRWWQIEDAAVDIGGFAPDRGHFATLLLIDLLASHGDNWFTLPLPVAPGHLAELGRVTVRDSFDRRYDLHMPQDWGLFAVSGLPRTSLLSWPTVSAPLRGSLQEDVVLGIDEDANALWAVELRANGRDLATEPSPSRPSPQTGTIDGSARKRYAYEASKGARPYWHPYVLEVDWASLKPPRLIQGRLADLRGPTPTLMPEPEARVLRDLAAWRVLDNWDPLNVATPPPAHWIEPAAVPPTGLRLQRRYVLARDTKGEPHLWAERRRLPLTGPPSSGLRWDVLTDA